jgi:hypothetical protein
MSETIDAQTLAATTTQEVAAEPTTKENSYHDLPEWARRRMGELAEQKRTASDRVSALEAQLNQYAQAPAAAAPQSQDDVMKMAKQIAQQEMDQRQFVERMSSIEQAAKKEFGDDYDRSISNLSMAGVQSNDFLRALAEIPNPEKVLVYLGKSENVGDAVKIANMSPLNMGIELTKLSSKAAKELSPSKSRAPAPVADVDGSSSARSSGGAEPPMTDTVAWMEWRRANARKKR